MSKEDEYIQQIRLQSQTQSLQTMQELYSKMTDKCFKLCTSKKGNSLDNSEINCLNNCIERYTDTIANVNQVFQSFSQQH